MLELFSKYNVNLNFSGHLHIQSIKNDNGIYDISSGSLLDYGNRYGKLDIYNNCYSYESILFVDENTKEYSFEVFCDEYYKKIVKKYVNFLGESEGEEVARLLSEINAYYFDGNYEQVYDLMNSNKKYMKYIKKYTNNYDKSYVKTIVEIENKNQHYLLIERQ